MPFQMLFASLGIQISHEERKSFRKCITGNRYANNKKYNLNEQKIWNKTKTKKRWYILFPFESRFDVWLILDLLNADLFFCFSHYAFFFFWILCDLRPDLSLTLVRARTRSSGLLAGNWLFALGQTGWIGLLGPQLLSQAPKLPSCQVEELRLGLCALIIRCLPTYQLSGSLVLWLSGSTEMIIWL